MSPDGWVRGCRGWGWEMAERSSVFFASDVMNGSEELAYRLGDDYGLSEEDTQALAEAIEDVIGSFFRQRDGHA